MTNEHEALSKWALKYPEALVIMEAGTHRPWVSRLFIGLGMEVIVAHPRKTRAIYQNERKSDRKDAVMLARLGRVDPALLHPVHHGSAQAQEDALQIKIATPPPFAVPYGSKPPSSYEARSLRRNP